MFLANERAVMRPSQSQKGKGDKIVKEKKVDSSTA